MEPDNESTRNEDTAFEAELRHALCRVEAPAGFADQVVALARQQKTAAVAAASATTVADVSLAKGAGKAACRHTQLLRFPVACRAAAQRSGIRVAFAAAALLALGVGGTTWERARTARREAQAAAQFNEAMRITDRALSHVSTQLSHTEFSAIARALQQNGGGER